jgi:hypothetical protein
MPRKLSQQDAAKINAAAMIPLIRSSQIQSIHYPSQFMNITLSPDLSTEDYIVLGVATCFIKQEGEVQQLQVIEPIPSATLETLCQGIPTSYEQVIATTLGQIIHNGELQLPQGFPSDAKIPDDFSDRTEASARTYKRDRQAHVKDLMPIGSSRDDFNYSLERKRILNAQRKIGKSDNVKQHEHTHKTL